MMTDFSKYRPVMRKWKLTTGSYLQVRPKETDILYADPPYDVEFTHYTPDGFTWKDQIELADWLTTLPCPVVASNQATARMLNLYRSLGFTVTTAEAPRRISCDGNRKPALEMLATRNLLV